MSAPPQLRVLFFDVFGTCVEQRKSVADELWEAAREALNASDSSINSEVRAKATAMMYDQWFDFGGKWNQASDKFVHSSIEEHKAVDWHRVDKNRIDLLSKLLADMGLIILQPSPDSTSTPRVAPGSLWDEVQLNHLGQIWHRLPPWQDTCRAITLLNKRYTTVTLSNTYNDLLKSLVSHGNIPFTHLFSADLFDSYKPSPAVYLGAAEKLGVKPEECGLVAAHLFDLKAAKACGFYPIYVERPLEEKAPELRREGIPELIVGEGEEGLLALAEKLGIAAD